jgi:hypothetical protein
VAIGRVAMFLNLVILVSTLLLGKIADGSKESWFKKFPTVFGSFSAKCSISALSVSPM